MKEKRNVKLRDALLKSLAIAAFTAVPATAIAPVASATVFLDDVNDDYETPTCHLGGDGRGDGTQDSPYHISTVEDLAEIGDCDYLDSGLYYILTNDIDATPHGNYNNDGHDWNTPDSGWEPIGDYHGESFSGNLNGAGHTISGLEIWASDDDQGLFAETSYAVIRNLTVEVEIDGNEYDELGAISGTDYTSTFVNVHAEVNIYEGEDNVGGLIGYAQGTRVSKSTTSGTIDGDTDDYSEAYGGLIGYATDDSYDHATRLTNVSSSVDINDFATNNDSDIEYEEVGGIVGDGDNVFISDAVFSGSAMGNNNLGGIVGYINDGGVNDAIVTEDATVGTAEDYYASSIGGVVGQADYNAAITNVQFNGTLDLDKTSTTEDSDYIGGIVGYLNDSLISSATVGSTAEISVRGNGSGSNSLGGVVGWADGSSISNVVNNADVTSTDVWGVGGIVGESDATFINKAVNRGDVHATDDDVSFDMGAAGGIVGFLDFRSTVSDSTNKGDVTLDGTEDAYAVGGIAGAQCDATVIDTYNTGDVTGVYDVAGITGLVVCDDDIIENSYSLGALTAYDDNIDGIANINNDDDYLNGGSNVVIIDATGKTNYTNAMLLTAAAVKDGEDLVDAGWALNTADGEWATDVEFNDGFPYLVWETLSSDIAPEVGLVDEEWSPVVTFNGGKRFRLYTSEKNALNAAISVIKNNPFASVDVDIYYGKKIRLAGKRALAVKRWLVYQGVDVSISTHIYQADNSHGVGSVHITANAN